MNGAMAGESSAVLRDIVLVGGGHSHVVVLRHFGMRPMPGVRLTLICADVHTPYSGMLPGYVAGHYSYDEVHIDLARLTAVTGARLYRGEAVGLDRAARKVLCRDRPPVPYDLLSINIGSTPRVDLAAVDAARVVPVKPIRNFNARWQALLERVRQHHGAMTIAVVGGGAGGVELLLAMQWRLRNELRDLGRDPEALAFHLLTASDVILPTHCAAVRNRFAAILAARRVRVHTGAPVTAVDADGVRTAAGAFVAADEVVWVTQARGAPWLADTGLALDADGCIEVGDSLQSLADPRIFAAGDVATMIDHRREKAGVFAVRQGRPLAENLRRALAGEVLRDFRPQRR